jgi:hypothetical protein
VGVQFHPESVLSAFGYEILDRFLHGCAPRTATLPAGPDGFAGEVRVPSVKVHARVPSGA